MGKAQKLFDKWSEHVPREARVQEVKTFLDTYFPHMWGQKVKGHYIKQLVTAVRLLEASGDTA